MNANAEIRVKRLADALSAVDRPLAPLFEYADELHRRLAERDQVGAECIAALLRARTETAKREIARSLDALEEAASRVADGPADK